MAKRSIKDSMNDAAFAFVKSGFDQPPKTNLVTMPKTETVSPQTEEEKAEPKKKARVKSEAVSSKPKAAKKSSPESDHLVSVSTRMPSSLFADLKKEALTRQLTGQTPNSLQQILIDAADEWLKKNAKQ